MVPIPKFALYFLAFIIAFNVVTIVYKTIKISKLEAQIIAYHQTLAVAQAESDRQAKKLAALEKQNNSEVMESSKKIEAIKSELVSQNCEKAKDWFVKKVVDFNWNNNIP